MSDYSEFKNWIKEKQIVSVYSDFNMDSRLSKEGVNRFSLGLGFEKGFAGGLRTLNKLLENCRQSFNRRYHTYFNDERRIVDIKCQKNLVIS